MSEDKEQETSLTVRHPLPSAPLLRQISLPPPLKLQLDLIELLSAERQDEH